MDGDLKTNIEACCSSLVYVLNERKRDRDRERESVCVCVCVSVCLCLWVREREKKNETQCLKSEKMLLHTERKRESVC